MTMKWNYCNVLLKDEHTQYRYLQIYGTTSNLNAVFSKVIRMVLSSVINKKMEFI